MKIPVPVVSTVVLVLLIVASGCVGDLQSKAGVGTFGGTPAPAVTGEPADDDCMTVCTRYSGQDQAGCMQTCCVADCGEDAPGGLEACTNRCLGISASGTQQGSLPVAGVTVPESAPAGFTCEYDQGLLDASAEYRTWFNTSCYYNTYCGWWEPVDLQPVSSPGQECTNCSMDSFSQPTPAPTPCPARTTKPGPTPTPAVTTMTLSSSGACGQGLTQCRVFSTDYCVDLMTDTKHCGACRKGCLLHHAENGCSGGICYIKKCDFGWDDCNGVASDGCEVDLNADDNNCGKCGRVCSLPNAGHALCNGVDENGKCEVEHCADGWLNANGLHEDGCEVFQN